MVKWQKKRMTMFLPVSPVGIVREQSQEFKKGAFCFYFSQVIFVYSLLFVCASCCRVRQAFSGCGVRASRRSDFSRRGSGPQRTGSVAKWTSWGTWTYCGSAYGIFPNQGWKPRSPELAGGFLSTAPPGKSCFFTCYKLRDGGWKGGDCLKAPQTRRPGGGGGAL